MGLFWDKLKILFGKKEMPILESGPMVFKKKTDVEISEDLFDAIDDYVTGGGKMVFKRVVFPKPYNARLAYSKSKSQRSNWKRWRRK